MIGPFHVLVALPRAAAVLGSEVGIQQRHQPGPERLASYHPLVIAPPTVVVRTVQPTAWHAGHQPPEQRLVIGVHAQRDLRLPSVAAEVTFTDQDAHQQADVVANNIAVRLGKSRQAERLRLHTA